MGGGLGGKQSTQVQVPAWLEGAAQQMLGRANDVSRIGYTPYFGPDVAAQTPDQIAAQGMNRSAASAFGLDPGAGGGLPAPQTFAGGVSGYSSQPIYQQALDALKVAAPGQFDLLMGQFVNPVAGTAPGAAAPSAATTAPHRAGPLPVTTSMTAARNSGASSRDLRRLWAAKANQR